MMRLAVVGFGRIAPRHVDAFRAIGCQIIASCNRSEMGRSKAREAGIPATYSNIEEMLVRERPDGVICCPSFDHVFEAACQLIPLQVPLLLEKPPGTSLADFAKLQSLISQYDTPVMIGFNRRHYSVIRKAIDDIGGKDAVTAVFVEWSENPRYLIADRGWTHEQASQTIFANSLHGLDLLTYLAGPLERPSVIATSRGEPLRWTMALHGVSTRGIAATFNSTWDSPGGWRLTICAPGRRYLFAPLETCTVVETGSQSSRSLDPDAHDKEFKPGFLSQARTFVEVVANGKCPGEYQLGSAAPSMYLADMLTTACVKQDHLANQNELLPR